MLRALLRRCYHAASHAPERLLHRSRHRAAVSRQAALGRSTGILILCHGNICRSPYAQAKLQQLFEEHNLGSAILESAGFFGPGRPAHHLATRTAKARGLDLTRHKSRTVDSALTQRASLILVMSSRQAMDLRPFNIEGGAKVEILGDFDPEPISRRDIADPYGGPPEEFERVFDRIDRCLASLIGSWER